MKKTNLKKSLLLLALGLAPFSAAFAQVGEIRGVRVEPAVAKAGVEVKITVLGDEAPANFCGFRIEYGGGEPSQDVKISKKDGVFPKVLTKKFNNPGAYNIAVKGKTVTTHPPCEGDAKTVLTVEAAPAAKPGKVAGEPSCPDGWSLVKGSVTSAGAFTCAVKKPDKKLECGPGLVYFDKGSTIGCKKK